MLTRIIKSVKIKETTKSQRRSMMIPLAKKSVYAFLPVSLLLIVFLGCASAGPNTRSDGATKELGVASILKFEDVPIPAGFRIVTDQSFSFQNELTRVGILRYAGRANAQRVIQFYKDQMPLYNWQFVNMIEYDRSLLNFEKADQTCTVTVEVGITKTALAIAVAPKGTSVSKK